MQSLRDNSIDLGDATNALATALAFEDSRLVGTMTRSMRAALANRTGQRPIRHDRLATQSLLLRQVERAAHQGAFAEAAPILSAFRLALD
jgi:hypothetical protein